jgi:hypothetical protein
MEKEVQKHFTFPFCWVGETVQKKIVVEKHFTFPSRLGWPNTCARTRPISRNPTCDIIESHSVVGRVRLVGENERT